MPSIAKDVTVGVIGAGTMGAGIAQVAAAAGHPVLLYDIAEGAAERGKQGIAKILARSVERGRIDTGERDATLGRITLAATLADMAPAGLVIEAVLEDLDVKRMLFGEVEGLVADDAILASNTSSLSITAIAAEFRRPERCVGMHFFNPAPILPLVEVVSGFKTDRAVAETVFATAEAWGKKPVHARSTPAFIVNRVARPFYGEGLRILGEGIADVPTVDAVITESGGFRMGPFTLLDLVGIDVNFAVTQSVYNAFFQDPRYQPSIIQREYVEAGLLGRKSGRGFYDYAEGAEKPAPRTAPTASRPEAVVIEGDLGIAEPLVGLIEAAGLPLYRDKQGSDVDPAIILDDVVLRLCDGRTATERDAEDVRELVLFDLALDYATCSRIAVAPADRAPDHAIAVAVGFFQALGKQVSVIDDGPGMIVTRTVCMLANEGADAVQKGVCDAAAVDTAMRMGVNYPQGPCAWADALGAGHVVTVLDNMARTYGEDRYRASPLLRRLAQSGRRFHG
ncbi:MAG: 3-hydroxyacyl-CoA dehydrogenase PaaC [Rhodospirillaceae bacterium]|nr:3-hydroxyacyl-CoA dehydrogenase PaaC [Rhodospirillaceae bacterium]